MTLGSGLGLEGADILDSIDFADVFYYKQPSVSGHPGKLSLASINGYKFILLQGRYHFYEGYSHQEVILPMLTMAKLGIKAAILTNSAGALNTDFQPGDIMLINDHINLTGSNPLIGLQGPDKTTFVNLSDAYNLELRKIVTAIAEELEVPLRQGVYVAVSGPTYETPAEVAFLRGIGGDAVGMSTVYETIASRFMGMKVCGVSVITNKAIGNDTLSHLDVLEQARLSSKRFSGLITKSINNMEEIV